MRYPTVWANAYPRFHMALWSALAVAWLILGANSGGVPWGTPTAWLVGNALVAGTALGVAYRGTRDSMLHYLAAALIAGTCRSLAYLVDGTLGPGWVWLIIALTNIVLLGHWTDRRAEQ